MHHAGSSEVARGAASELLRELHGAGSPALGGRELAPRRLAFRARNFRARKR